MTRDEAIRELNEMLLDQSDIFSLIYWFYDNGYEIVKAKPEDEKYLRRK